MHTKSTRGGNILDTEKVYTIFPRGGTIHPQSQHLSFQLFAAHPPARQATSARPRAGPLSYWRSERANGELKALRPCQFPGRSVNLDLTLSAAAIVSFEICKATCPSGIEDAF